MAKTLDDLIGDILKADLLLSDYTLVDDPEDKETTLELLGRYIYDMGDNNAVYLYSKICDSSPEENDLYVWILMDYLKKQKSEVVDVNCEKGKSDVSSVNCE